MESQPTALSQLFDVDESKDQDFYRIKIGQRFMNAQTRAALKVTATLIQKKYDENAPTVFQLTLGGHYSGMPVDEHLEFNYHSSIVSSEKKIEFVAKPSSNCADTYLFLVVDGIWKDQTTIEPYTLSIEVEGLEQAVIEKYEERSHAIGELAASRCQSYQPTRTAVVEHYEGLKRSYKIIDYGNPSFSLYGIIIIVAHGTSEIIESFEFDNLQDFYIVGYPEGTNTIPVKLLVENYRILLKRKALSDQSFSF